MFRLRLNDQDVFYKHFTFPGGEEHIKIQKAGIPVGKIQTVVIDAHIKSSADFIELALLVNAVRGLGNVDRLTTFHAYIPYFPYARQDRHCDFGEPLSVKWAAEFINSMNFDRVAIKDPHSHVVSSLINNVHVVPQDYIARQYLGWFIRGNNAVLVAPDGGAAKKTETLSLSLDGVPVVYGHKNRDTKTGEIIGVSITNPELIRDRYLVVVDDICDGGRTFVELGKELQKHEPKHMTLFVTHGIFSKGLSVFDGIYDAVYADTVWWENITADGLPFKTENAGRVK